jgi:HD-GYP domain-containing protein (c-di-GMP phosphodiesterase class II)
MLPQLLRLLSPPVSTDYERTQKAKLLHVTLLVVFAASLVIGVINLGQNAAGLAAFLFGMSAYCLLGLYLNRTRHVRSAAFVLCSLLFLAIGYDLLDGAALHDPGVAAYPILILCSSFFFGPAAILYSTAASTASVAVVYGLAAVGLIQPAYEPTLNRVLILAILYGGMACLAWVIRHVWVEARTQLVQSYELTLEGWARALEYRDGETEGHSRRVTMLCVDLARRLGCGDDEIVQVRLGAYLHDIGKMALPDSILFKPGPLTEDEMALMKRHPAIAVNMISGIPFLQPALPIPRSHHENWDGSGYPQGMKGDQIPYIARLFTVVDHWDALSSDRPYRKAWPPDKVRSYLRDNAGKIYDPQIVDVFLAMQDETGAGQPAAF